MFFEDTCMSKLKKKHTKKKPQQMFVTFLKNKVLCTGTSKLNTQKKAGKDEDTFFSKKSINNEYQFQ